MTTRLVTADAVVTPRGRLGNAVLVEHDRVVAVGEFDDLSGDIVERHPGAVIVPGFRDAHLHPVGYTASLIRPSLKTAADFAELADIVAEAATGQPKGSAITALRLDDESLAEGRLPDRHLLDRVAPDRPVLVVRYCGHVAVANTVALELAGVDTATADPAGGVIDRDATGTPTGVLRETAVDPVAEAIRLLAPPVTSDDVVDAAHALAATGLTGIGAMVSTDQGCWAGAGSELDVLMEAAPRLPIDVGVLVIARDHHELRRAAAAIEAAPGRLRFLGVKMFSDGSLGGHTAAMHHGFADRPDVLGTDRLDPEIARELATTSLDLGGRVAIHAIGDRANCAVLDVMDTLIHDGADPAHLRVEHASVLTDDDIARFGRLGVTASVQPAFIASETEWLEKRLGPDRIESTYAFRSLTQAGAPLAGGSDSPVEPPHPLPGIATARDRCGIVPGQGLDAAEALELFTTSAATAIAADASLEPGSTASFTVIDRDPLVSTADEVRRADVVATWVDGAAVPLADDVVTWQA